MAPDSPRMMRKYGWIVERAPLASDRLFDWVVACECDLSGAAPDVQVVVGFGCYFMMEDGETFPLDN